MKFVDKDLKNRGVEEYTLGFCCIELLYKCP